MGTRIDYPFFNRNHCSVCGSKAWTGCWSATDLVQICRRCATHVLPALIADATWYPSWTAVTAAHDLARIEAVFWRAQSLNLQRKRKGQGAANV